MSVSTYKPECKYRLDKLEKVVYLINEDSAKDIQIDNGAAYVSGITSVSAVTAYSINLEENEALDERYAFTHTLSFSINGYANHRDFQGKYYAIVKSLDGGYWLLNPMFPSKITYTYTLDGGSSHTDFTMGTVSNFPILPIHGLNETTPYQCGYQYCHLKSLKLNDKKYVQKNGNTVKYTNAGGFRTIDYNKNSCIFTETFDGTNIQHKVEFNIQFSDYKSSFHYNLLEFVDNKYAAIVETSCDKYVLTGFHFGLQPSFTVTASDDAEPDNIKIELGDLHDNGSLISYGDLNLQFDGTTSYEYTYEHDGYECVSINTARYLLKKEIDALGNETGNFMCLDGYESQFPDLNIVDTFEETETFGNLTCGGRVCTLRSGIPNEIILTTTGTSIDSYLLGGDSDWYITSDADYISVSPSSGQSDRNYFVSITNSRTPSSYPVRSKLTLHYCDNKTLTFDVVVRTLPSCFTAGDTFNIAANRQYVTVPTRCCVQSVVESSQTLSLVSIEDSYFSLYVPQNNSSARTFTVNVTFCDGTTGTVTVNQSQAFERWVKETRMCFEGEECDVERKYTGLTQSSIDFPTDETRTTNCTPNSGCTSIFQRWVDTPLAICEGYRKYRIEELIISTDGETWESGGKRRIGAETVDSPAECGRGEETWEEVEDDYMCDGVTKFTREELYLDGVGQGIYRKGSTVLESNSEDCGYDSTFSGYSYTESRVEGWTCDGYDKYEWLTWYVSNDGINWENTGIQSLGNLIEANAMGEYNVDGCGYEPEYLYSWRSGTTTICGGYDLYYQYQKYQKPYGADLWTPVIPTTYSMDGQGTMPLLLAESGSTACGHHAPIVPEYKWVLMENDYICDDCDSMQYRWEDVSGHCEGNDYYMLQKKQQSTDGETWTDVSPSETQDIVVEYNSNRCQEHDYANDYLTFIAREDGTFSFSNAMSYSIDSGTTWTTLEGGTNTPTIQSGETVMWKGNSRPYQGGGIGTFSSTGAYDVEGNAMSLLFSDNFEGETSLVGKDYAFYTLFQSNRIVNAENLILPATALSLSCYDGMFYGCSGLTTAPSLLATTLANSCYRSMFEDCTSLTTVPSVLPATTLATHCYSSMFDGCTSLTTAPMLPAPILVEASYSWMFFNCTSLQSITCLATDISATDCTTSWVDGVALASPNGVFTKAASMTSWRYGGSGIPTTWTIQDYQP